MLANGGWDLTLILLTWTIWRVPTNASKWRMGFNSAFKALKQQQSVVTHRYTILQHTVKTDRSSTDQHFKRVMFLPNYKEKRLCCGHTQGHISVSHLSEVFPDDLPHRAETCNTLRYIYIIKQQQSVVTHRYTVIQQTEGTGQILNGPTLTYVMFLANYKEKRSCCGHNILTEAVCVCVCDRTV